MESGTRDDRHRLVGAYQGIALGEAQRAAARHDVGPVHELVSCYEQGYVILHPLKDATISSSFWNRARASPWAAISSGRRRPG